MARPSEIFKDIAKQGQVYGKCSRTGEWILLDDISINGPPIKQQEWQCPPLCLHPEELRRQIINTVPYSGQWIHRNSSQLQMLPQRPVDYEELFLREVEADQQALRDNELNAPEPPQEMSDLECEQMERAYRLMMLASEGYPSDEESIGNILAEAEDRQNARRIWKSFPNNGYYYPAYAYESDEDQYNGDTSVSSEEEQGEEEAHNNSNDST